MTTDWCWSKGPRIQFSNFLLQIEIDISHFTHLYSENRGTESFSYTWKKFQIREFIVNSYPRSGFYHNLLLPDAIFVTYSKGKYDSLHIRCQICTYKQSTNLLKVFIYFIWLLSKIAHSTRMCLVN